MYLGIDIGTSRTKAAIVTNTGRLIASDSIPTPAELLEPGADILKFVSDSLMGLILRLQEKNSQPEAICVSSVAPTLVAFYENRAPQIVFSHLTPTTVHYSQGSTLDSRLAFRRSRTEDRLSNSKRWLAGQPRFYLPLASAISLLISDEIVLDPINAYELGFSSIEQMKKFCSLTGVYKTNGAIGIDNKNRVKYKGRITVTTDSCASMIGAGLRKPSDGMIYYGTYHSALELNIPIWHCLSAQKLSEIPYFWHVSLPQYGKFLESFLVAITGECPVDVAFTKFQKAIMSWLSFPDTKQIIKAHPQLPEIVTSDTPLVVQLSNLSTSLSFIDLAVAIASPLGNSMRSKLHSGDLNRVGSWFAAGGGAQSREMVRLTSQLTGICQALYTGPGTAKGAAMVAAHIHQAGQNFIDETEVEIIEPNPT